MTLSSTGHKSIKSSRPHHFPICCCCCCFLLLFDYEIPSLFLHMVMHLILLLSLSIFCCYNKTPESKSFTKNRSGFGHDSGSIALAFAQAPSKSLLPTSYHSEKHPIIRYSKSASLGLSSSPHEA